MQRTGKSHYSKKGPAKRVNNEEIVKKMEGEDSKPIIEEGEIVVPSFDESAKDKQIYNVQDQYGNFKERVVVDLPKPIEHVEEPKIATIVSENPEIKKEEVPIVEAPKFVEHQPIQLNDLIQLKKDIMDGVFEDLNSNIGLNNIRYVSDAAKSRKEPNMVLAASDVISMGLSSAVVGIGAYISFKWLLGTIWPSKKHSKPKVKKAIILCADDVDDNEYSDDE